MDISTYFSAAYNAFDNFNFIDIHKCFCFFLKSIFGLIKKLFIVLLPSIFNASNHTKYLFLSNQQWKTEPTLINLLHNEYSQGLQFYPFAVNLHRCFQICNVLDDLSIP